MKATNRTPALALSLALLFGAPSSAQDLTQKQSLTEPFLDQAPSSMQLPPPAAMQPESTTPPAPASPSGGSTRYDDLSVNPEPARLHVDPHRDEESSRLRYLTLFIGVQTSEPLPRLPRGFVIRGDFRKIAKVSISRQSNTLLFEAKKEGVATLTILSASGTKLFEFRLDSRQSNLTKVAREMRALLFDIEGITIKIVNNRVVVDGQVLLPREIDRIHSVVAQFAGLADTLVRLSPVAQKKIAVLIQNQINNPEIQVVPVNDKFMLEGFAANKEERDRAEIIAKLFVPDMVKTSSEAAGLVVPLRKDFVINLIQVRPGAPPEPEKPIQLIIHYVELNKNYQNGFRFDFSPAISDGSSATFTSDSRTPGGLVSTITGTISNLLPKLNWSKQHGYARVLESTSIIVLNKQKGTLQSGMKVPFQTTNAQGQPSTGFEDVGIKSTVTPEILNARSDNIRLTMAFSISALLGISDKGPLTSKNEVDTVVMIRSGQSAAIGGLITNQTSTDFNKLPRAHSDNPIISLYASKSFQRDQSQFVVFLTPIIKSSASAGSEKIKKKMRLRD